MKDIIAELAQQRESLQKLANDSVSGSVKRWAQILLGVSSGLSKRAVSRQVKCSRETIQTALAKFEAGGVEGLMDRRKGNYRLPKRPELIAALPKWVMETPSEHGWLRSTWSVELLTLQAFQTMGVKVSRTHLGRLLREAGCRRVVPRPSIALAPADKEEQIKELRATLAQATRQDVVLYADEVDIHLNPKSGPDWTAPKVRKQLVTPGRNEKRYIAGAFNPKSKKLTFVSGAKKNSELFITLLRKLVKQYWGFATIHVVLDNFIIHRSKKTNAVVQELGKKVKLYWLPPYSPEYNPIERVWWDLHAGITRNHRCPNMEALMANAGQYLVAYSGKGSVRVGRTIQ